MNKLWSDQRNINKRIESFTIGKDAQLDEQIARYDILGSMAHAIMLRESEIISADDLSKIMEGLNTLLQKADDGNLQIPAGVEDIHSYVELELSTKISDSGNKLQTVSSSHDKISIKL